MIAIFAMFGQQITEQAFPSQYQVIFYQEQGLGANSFLYNVISNIIGLIAIIMTWLTIDSTGCRPTPLFGGTMMAAFMLILGGMGPVAVEDRSNAMSHVMVASFMLFGFFFNLSWAPMCVDRRKISRSLLIRTRQCLRRCFRGCSFPSQSKDEPTVDGRLRVDHVPYIFHYAVPDQRKVRQFRRKLGYIYGAINILVVIGLFFFIPELKGRSLEEVDQLFASGVSLRKFKDVQTRTAEEIYEDESYGKREKDNVRVAETDPWWTVMVTL